MSEPLVGIVIPVRNCLQLTVEAIASIRTRWPHRLYIIDDHSDVEMKQWLASLQDITLFTDPVDSQGLASNWNLGIDAAIVDGCTHIVVANNDIRFHPLCIDRLIERIDVGDVVLVSANNVSGKCRTPDEVLTYIETECWEIDHPDFACFIVTASTFPTVGWFDEGYLGAYYEDNDYNANIVSRGYRTIRSSIASFYHHSQSTVGDPANASSLPSIGKHSAHNGTYFCAKWGWVPLNDPEAMKKVYNIHPFNDSKRSVFAEQPGLERVNYLHQRVLHRNQQAGHDIELAKRYASTVKSVLHMAAGDLNCSASLLAANPCRLILDRVASGDNARARLAACRGAARAIATQLVVNDGSSTPACDMVYLEIPPATVGDLARAMSIASRYVVVRVLPTEPGIPDIMINNVALAANPSRNASGEKWEILVGAAPDSRLTILRRKFSTGAKPE